jgi:hypothetical protein
MILFLNGPAIATVTDPFGRNLSSGRPARQNANTEPIPGGEYLTVPGEDFQLVLIPEPVEGEYQIAVKGSASATYSIGMLDTFDPPEQTSPNLTDEWDTATSQMEPGAMIQFSIPYMPGSQDVNLFAENPVIEIPVYADAQAVSGLAIPRAEVEIRDDDNSLLGNGVAAADGLYSVSLNQKLRVGQSIYAYSSGQSGIPVVVLGRYTYLPGVMKLPQD